MPPKSKRPLLLPGAFCQPDARKSGLPLGHVALDPVEDPELQAVHRWLVGRPIVDLMREATDSAVKYVLDGARTWRFDLTGPAVDSDERASVGTKLQYHIIQQLGLKKEPPLDTSIAGVAVEIKGTVGRTWMIPREGQCQVTLMVRIDAANHRFGAWLMRTHRIWLNEGTNQDAKRTPIAEAVTRFALPIVPWTSLPDEPLRALSREQLEVVLGAGGLKRRLVSLFSFLPGVIIPRSSIAIVGAGLGDPMKRAREAKVDLRTNHDLIVLVGTWGEERELAATMGYDIREEAWVAVPADQFAADGLLTPLPRPNNGLHSADPSDSARQ